MFLLPLLVIGTAEAQLQVESYPSILFNKEDAISLMEGTALWLYCKVNSVEDRVGVIWTKNGRQLVKDLPHVYTTSSVSQAHKIAVVVVDGINFDDAGVYWCSANDNYNNIYNGTKLTYSVLLSSFEGGMELDTYQEDVPDCSKSNRIRAKYGQSISLNFMVSYYDDNTTNYEPPAVLWFRDGLPISIEPYDEIIDIGLLSSSLDFSFHRGDEGVYQCIFSMNDGTIFLGSYAIKIDYGFLSRSPKAVSPLVLFHEVPHTLVLEVEGTGGYESIEWIKNSEVICPLKEPDDGYKLAFFDQVLYRTVTSEMDYGRYWAEYRGLPDGVQFLVLKSEISMSADGNTIMVEQGDSVNLSCSLYGKISENFYSFEWKKNNKSTKFEHTSVFIKSAYSDPSNVPFDIGLLYDRVTSTLHIPKANYPLDEGIYQCMASNNEKSWTDNINLRIQVTSTITANSQYFGIKEGSNLNISCTLTGILSDTSYTLRWEHNRRRATHRQTEVFVQPPHGSDYVVSTLQIINAKPLRDEGAFVCIGSNSFNTSRDTITVKIHSFRSIIPTTTDILNIHANDNINVSCTLMEVDSPTSYSITWKHNGKNINRRSHNNFIKAKLNFSTLPSVSARSIYNQVVSNIMITKATYSEDDGKYECIGTNNFGTTSAKITVIIKDQLSITEYRPHGMVQLYMSGEVRFKCVAFGTPTPTVEWGVIEESSLELKSFSKPRATQSRVKRRMYRGDTGRYGCKVSNKYEVLYSPPIAVIVYDENSLRVNATTWDSVYLHLYRPIYLSSFIKYYWVTYSDDGRHKVKRNVSTADFHLLDKNTVELILSNLHPETIYSISIITVGSGMRVQDGLKLNITAATSSFLTFDLQFKLINDLQNCTAWIAHNESEKSEKLLEMLSKMMKTVVTISSHQPSNMNSSFYCHSSTPQYVVFNARIYGSMDRLASNYFKQLERWVSDDPVEEIEKDEIKFISACQMSNTRYGMSICRDIVLRNDEDIYDYGNDTTIRTLSASDILDKQMKIVLIVAITVGVFLPIGIIGVVILASILEAVRVCLADQKAKGIKTKDAIKNSFKKYNNSNKKPKEQQPGSTEEPEFTDIGKRNLGERRATNDQVKLPEQAKRSAQYEYAQRNNNNKENGSKIESDVNTEKMLQSTTQSLKCFEDSQKGPSSSYSSPKTQSSPAPIYYSTDDAFQNISEDNTPLKKRDKSQSVIEHPQSHQFNLTERSKSFVGTSDITLMETFESTSEGKPLLKVRGRSKSVMESSGSEFQDVFESTKSVLSH